MRNERKIWLGMLLCLSLQWPLSVVRAQLPEKYDLLWEKPIPSKGLYADKLLQPYTISPDNAFKKWSPEGLELGHFANPALGRLASADVSDPFNVLLFYPDYQTILLLDRTLNPLTELRLSPDDFPHPVAAAMTRNNQIVVYDDATYRLKQVNQLGQITAESQDLSQIDAPPQAPVTMVAGEEGIFLADTASGIWVFDRLGQYQFTLPITGVDFLQLFDRYLIYRRKGEYFIRPTENRLRLHMSLPEPSTLAFFQKNRLYLYHNQVLKAYAF